MRLSGIDEDKGDALWGKLLGHRLQDWRRQPAVGSGYGAELDYQRPIAPVVGQPHSAAITGVGELPIGRWTADLEYVGEVGEVITIHLQGKASGPTS